MDALLNYMFFDGAGALTWPLMGAAVIGAICVGIWNFFKRPS